MTDTDIREQLFNDRAQGPAATIALKAVNITTLHGFFGDLDPHLLREDNPCFRPDKDPRQFHVNILPVLERHPLFCHAQIRLTGTGLHAVIRFDPPVELTSGRDQQWWDDAVKVVQCTLPVDPNAPGITALTRPAGAVNSKNGRTVEILKDGHPVDQQEVRQFIDVISEAPYKEVTAILFGPGTISPCPVCRGEGTCLEPLDRIGKCYGCGKVKLDQVFDTIYAPLPRQTADGGGKPDAAATGKPKKPTRKKKEKRG